MTATPIAPNRFRTFAIGRGRRQRAALAALALVAGAGLAACGSGLTQPTSPGRRLVQEAEVRSIAFLESCPPQVVVEVLVSYGACETVQAPVIEMDGDTISIVVEVEEHGTICPASLHGQILHVRLGSDFAPGDYRLRVPSRSNRLGAATFTYPAGCT